LIEKEPLIEPCVTLPLPPVSPASPAATVSVGLKPDEVITTVARVKLSVVTEDRVERITGIRKAMVKAMTRAQQVPHFGYDDEVTIGIATLSLMSFNKAVSV